MGNQFPCKSAERTVFKVLDTLSCNYDSDDDSPSKEFRRGQGGIADRRYREAMQGASIYDRPGMPGGFGPAGPPPGARKQPSPSPAQRTGQLPGESCLVTYDVNGPREIAPISYPGESTIVTSSVNWPSSHVSRTRSNDQASPQPSMAGTSAERVGPSMEAFPSAMERGQEPNLQPTKSFDVEAPYKVGDTIQIWSTSNQAWCNGTVEKAQGEWVHISYKSPAGQQISKVMPNGHEHLRFHSWQTDAPPSPQKAQLPAAPPANTASPPRPLDATIPNLEAGDPYYSPQPGARTYKVGDEVELWSTSQNNWVRGSVHKAEGDWVTIAYNGPQGPMTKIMPNGHEQIRTPEVPLATAGFITALSPIREDFSRDWGNLSPTQTQNWVAPSPGLTVDSLPAPPPPAPTQQAYKVGDNVEIWSTSQQTWCRASVSKVEGDWAHIAYRGPGNQPMNKIMPNGHAHLRLLTA